MPVRIFPVQAFLTFKFQLCIRNSMRLMLQALLKVIAAVGIDATSHQMTVSLRGADLKGGDVAISCCAA